MISDKFKKLKGKRILITAGPTWVPIDSVRVISNIATGKTGIILAEKLRKAGCKVTLLLGPIGNYQNKKIRLLRFRFFDELRNKLTKELCVKKYDFVIHSAAVSDFKPTRLIKGKIHSAVALGLKLLPLPKIIEDIRRLAPRAKLVMFKFEPGASSKTLIHLAKSARAKISADFVVANKINPYRAFIIDRQGKILTTAVTKELLANNLLKFLTYNF